MKFTDKQKKAFNSSADVTIFGFSAGCGKTSLLLESVKRVCQYGNKTVLWLDPPRDLLKKYFPNGEMFDNYMIVSGNSCIRFSDRKKSVKLLTGDIEMLSDTPVYDLVVYDNAHSLSDDALQDILNIGSTRTIITCNAPEHPANLLTTLASPYLLENGALSQERMGKLTKCIDKTITYVGATTYENPHIHKVKGFVDILTGKLSDRLLLGKFKLTKTGVM